MNKSLQLPSNTLSSDHILLLIALHEEGSLAAAARRLGLVPSALTYRVRQLEEQLDALLIDRSSRRAVLTPAGLTLAHEGRHWLNHAESLTARVKRVASGWEPRLCIAMDNIVSSHVILELSQQFLEPFKGHSCPTEIRIRSETMTGTLESLETGEADLAIGIVLDGSSTPDIASAALGTVEFVFAVAPQHPLANIRSKLSDTQILAHRAVAIADTVRKKRGASAGLLEGQEVFTVPSMALKLEAHLRGIGCGFLPLPVAQPYIKSGELVTLKTQRASRVARISYAWRQPSSKSTSTSAPPLGKALQWWLKVLERPKTRAALLWA